MAPGSTTTYTVTVQLENCSAGGVLTENTASITTISTDPNPANNSATASFTTEANEACMYLACDAEGCFDNACVINDHCNGTFCEAEPANGDDNSVCTDDSCDPRIGIINDPIYCGDDGNPCTGGYCDPVNGCMYSPERPARRATTFWRVRATTSATATAPALAHWSATTATRTDDLPMKTTTARIHAPTSPGVDCSGSNPCTAGFTCDGFSHCSGPSPAAPDEVGMALVDKSGTDAVIVWPAAANADNYDVLRGSRGAAGRAGWSGRVLRGERCRGDHGQRHARCAPGRGLVRDSRHERGVIGPTRWRRHD